MLLFIFVSFIISSNYALFDRNVPVACDQNFNPSNWMHPAFIVLLTATALIIITILVFILKRCWPILKQTCQQQQQPFSPPLTSIIPPPTHQHPYPNLWTSFQHQPAPSPHTTLLLSSPREAPASLDTKSNSLVT